MIGFDAGGEHSSVGIERLGHVDLNCPCDAGCPPVKLLVPPVAPPPNGLRQRHTHDQHIENLVAAQVAVAYEKQGASNTGKDAAWDTQPAFPDLDPVANRNPISEHVIDPRTHDACRDDPHKYLDWRVGMQTSLNCSRPGDDRGRDDAETNHQPVQSKTERADIDRVERWTRDRPEQGWAKRRCQQWCRLGPILR